MSLFCSTAKCELHRLCWTWLVREYSESPYLACLQHTQPKRAKAAGQESKSLTVRYLITSALADDPAARCSAGDDPLARCSAESASFSTSGGCSSLAGGAHHRSKNPVLGSPTGGARLAARKLPRFVKQLPSCA